ncbi:hypothetical protein BWQ96_01250 [Gracilariopsis chorda]|uniref:Prenylcysteine oxidase n=1 Tax=Gracilariopsis chorda TaxID=448386 RepID=A0A2V3J3C4_9FLOR|nr:hypothetical protein BWQ96_01250 [Gracilariopsis chorda]|eukprot:PXF48908.1 hypothetical protein BWQ96_01250 [Gracilariopsis chorda]
MRVAIIGGNLLGCATAFYTRKANPHAHIHIFERRSRLGGNKLATRAHALLGSACTTDVSSAPLFLHLLSQARIKLTCSPVRAQWALFDLKLDSYKLSSMPSLLLRYCIHSRVIPILLQLASLSATAFFVNAFSRGTNPFLRYARSTPTPTVLHFPTLALFAACATFAFGLVPSPLMLRLFNFLFFVFWVRLIAAITYGAESIAVLSSVINHMHNHLSAIVKHDAASSCVTLGHLLSACGLGKYVKQSSTAFFSKYRLHPELLPDTIHPALVHTYADSTAPRDASALAVLLAMLAKSPLPASQRSTPTILSSTDADSICPALATASSAHLTMNTYVTDVRKSSDRWHLFTQSNHSEKLSLGEYDAVILAAVVDPSRFSAHGLGEHLAESLALTAELSDKSTSRTTLNVAKYTAIVKGVINADYLRKSSPSALPTFTTVLNSVNCTEIQRLEPDVWRVVTGERPTKDSNVIATLFQSVQSIISYDNPQRPYGCAALEELDGSHAPTFILGTRFLNAACVDRVANDFNLDCLSAMNTASFFKEGVAIWKE